MKEELKELKKELAKARTEVSGKTFDQCPDTFKDIEGYKVRIAYLESKNGA